MRQIPQHQSRAIPLQKPYQYSSRRRSITSPPGSSEGELKIYGAQSPPVTFSIMLRSAFGARWRETRGLRLSCCSTNEDVLAGSNRTGVDSSLVGFNYPMQGEPRCIPRIEQRSLCCWELEGNLCHKFKKMSKKKNNNKSLSPILKRIWFS